MDYDSKSAPSRLLDSWEVAQARSWLTGGIIGADELFLAGEEERHGPPSPFHGRKGKAVDVAALADDISELLTSGSGSIWHRLGRPVGQGEVLLRGVTRLLAAFAQQSRLRATEGWEAEGGVHQALAAAARVPIQTFAPEPYALNKHIEVVVRRVAGAYVASFIDAHVSASGDTFNEAVDNLKSVMLDRFDYLSAQKAEKLGPIPKRTLAVLREFISSPGAP